MRYGIVREGSRLPPEAVQRRLLEAEGCEVILQEGEATHESQHRLFRLLRALKKGDEVVVHGLDCFQAPTGQLAILLRDFLSTGVVVEIVGEPTRKTNVARATALQLLSLLSEHEARAPGREPPPGAGRRRKGLTRHQIDYAKRLYKDGASLRQIGLLFQVSPNEAMDIVRD